MDGVAARNTARARRSLSIINPLFSVGVKQCMLPVQGGGGELLVRHCSNGGHKKKAQSAFFEPFD